VKLVVDTNIIFSGILSPKGTISDLLLNSENGFNFYSPTFILEELENHKNKLLKISGYSPIELVYQKQILQKKINLIDLQTIKKLLYTKQ